MPLLSSYWVTERRWTPFCLSLQPFYHRRQLRLHPSRDTMALSAWLRFGWDPGGAVAMRGCEQRSAAACA